MADIKKFVGAKLPNIRGTWWIDKVSKWILVYDGGHYGGVTGAFYGHGPKISDRNNLWSTGGYADGDQYYILGFNASRSNPIYSDEATTVQPDAYTVAFIMRIE